VDDYIDDDKPWFCLRVSGMTDIDSDAMHSYNVPNLGTVELTDFETCFIRDYKNKAAPPLVSIDVSGTNLGECEGDCDNDGHCQDGFMCFQRSGTTAVPGCSGTGTSDWDYCVQEDADGPPLDSTAGGSGTNLAECAGDCDNDDDCQDGLTCFQRSGYTLVPGCTGSGTSSWDYCIAS